MSKPTKKELLAKPVEHIDITKIDGKSLVDSYAKMSFSARDLARAATIYDQMLADPNCSVWLTLAGSTSAGGCMQAYGYGVNSS